MKKYFLLILLAQFAQAGVGISNTGNFSRVGDLSSSGNLINSRRDSLAQIAKVKEKPTIAMHRDENRSLVNQKIKVFQVKMSDEANLVQFQAATPKMDGKQWDIRTYQGKATDLSPSMKDALQESVNSRQWQNVKEMQMQGLGR